MRLRNTARGLTLALAGGFAAGPATAAPIATLDSAAFTYRWDFNGGTTAENYDRYNSTSGVAVGDGTNEWNATPTPVAGVASTVASFSNPFWISSTAATTQITVATGYTVESRVKLTTSDALVVIETTLAGTTAAVQARATDAAAGTYDLYFDLPAGVTGGVRATVAADEFFTVRIAATPDVTKAGGLSYSLYVNDVLSGDDLDAERTTLATRRFFMGDTGGSTSGTTEVDYVAFTSGAFAPIIPEPGSLALAGLGSLCMLVRRRR